MPDSSLRDDLLQQANELTRLIDEAQQERDRFVRLYRENAIELRNNILEMFGDV